MLRGQHRDVLVVVVFVLFLLYNRNFLPGGADSMGARWKVVQNRLMQFRQIVARHRSVHVVFDVVVHVPVEKPEKRIHSECPAAEAEIRNVVLQADVLSVVAHEEEPAPVERAQTRHERDEPPAIVQGDDQDQAVDCKMGACPPDDGARFFGVVSGEESDLPIARKLPARISDRGSQDIVHALYVDKAGPKEMPDHQSNGQNDFQIIRRVQRVLMVSHVARVEERKVDPTDEGEDTHEQTIEPLRFEHTLVDQFMQSVDGKRGCGAVEKYECDNCPPRPVAHCVESTAAGHNENSQISQRLQKAPDIALGIELRENLTIDRGSIPLHKNGAIAVLGPARSAH